MDKILIVEDEKDVQDVLAEALKIWGYETVLASNGEEGLEKYRQQNFSMLITDIRMPQMDGLTMLKKIREKDTAIPILVVTGYPSVDSAVESLIKGADNYIVKPINMDDLHAKIGKAFEKRKVQLQLSRYKRMNLVLILLLPVALILGYMLAQLINM